MWRTTGLTQTGTAPDARGLFAWDGGWYREIAGSGYRFEESVRFFPLLPWLTAALSLAGCPHGAALLLITWSAALGYGVLVAHLTTLETGDPRAGRRAAWLAQ